MYVRVRRAALVALAVSGLATSGAGVGFAAGDGANATGGSGLTGSAFEQNTAQESRQNNNCGVRNDSGNNPTAVSGGLTDSDCTSADASFNKDSLVDSGGADANGGGAATTAFQQNTAQQGRQNNNCDNENLTNVTLTGGSLDQRCNNRDGSSNEHTFVKGEGAHAAGGNAVALNSLQQNTAQEGRQNNNCGDANSATVTAVGGRREGLCANGDDSLSHNTAVKGGGADAAGGDGILFSTVQQNTAQEGRQNNNCDNTNIADLGLTGAGRGSRCVNHDGSASNDTLVTGEGAHAAGGTSPNLANQQNTAQEGRQNNNCDNANASRVPLTGAGQDGRCVNADSSLTEHSVVHGGGADATGGSAGGLGGAHQQNTAQEGRQNNNCSNDNQTVVEVIGGRQDDRCVNKDGSVNDHTLVKGEGAHAAGGESGASLFQQNTAQEGRQNNNCDNANGVNDLGQNALLTGGTTEGRCVTEDGSYNRGTVVKNGGADALGGSGGLGVVQQNTAQEGRQNNSCGNANGGDIELTGARTESRCATVDHSANVGTVDVSDGAEAAGGSSALELFQQNTAQEGRQNNSCGNTNNLDLTLSGGRSRTQCSAIDESTNIHTTHR
ncbi:hypothetical protein ACFC0D_12095 [Streptomyces sp. NPDC056222]|uniref:hypothetical protein n=1 Tax=Streptomyces sp. NPDC056222 TaxID=3345749 RepID=UPI0035D923D6